MNFLLQANHEILDRSTRELDKAAKDSAAIYSENSMDTSTEIAVQDIPMDNPSSSTEDLSRSNSGLYFTTEGTQLQTEPFEQVFSSEINIEDHAVKLEPRDRELDHIHEHHRGHDAPANFDLAIFQSDQDVQLILNSDEDLSTIKDAMKAKSKAVNVEFDVRKFLRAVREWLRLAKNRTTAFKAKRNQRARQIRDAASKDSTAKAAASRTADCGESEM
ncbi:hypothetical protein B566_EDAN014199 [Ephemera danica]|nr:hypothetical protein B566_EDAN014199 [Ephemera danica]